MEMVLLIAVLVFSCLTAFVSPDAQGSVLFHLESSELWLVYALFFSEDTSFDYV